MKTIQKWNGWIDEVTGDTFWAQLIAVEGEGAEHQAHSAGEIFISAVHPNDRELVQPGAYFSWTIEEDATGNAQSTIRFHRLEPFSQDEVGAAMERAQAILEMLS